MPAPTPDQIPSLIESPQFQALPFEKRKSVAENALAEGAASLAGKWDKPTYQKWGQFAQTIRDKVTASESMTETAGRYAGVAGGAIKDSLATVGTMAVGLSPVVPTEQGLKAQVPGKTLAEMTGANLAGLATGAAQAVLDDPKPLQGKLQALKQGIDNGDFFDHAGGLPDWLGQQDQGLSAEQAKFYRENPEQNGAWHKENSLLANPKNAEALNVYLRTRSPQAWQQLEQSVLQTPGMAKVQREKSSLMNDSTLGQALKPEARPYIQAAGDPAELAGMVMTAGAGNAALKVGKTMLQRGASVAKGVGAEMLSEQVSASMDSAFVPLEQRIQIAKDSLVASLGLMGVGAGAQRISQGKTTNQPATNEPVSAGQTPVENPFSGPIEAPPQPTEDGGQVVTGPVLVPAFRDNPLDTPAPVGSGNLIADYGIAKTPEAQVQADAANSARQQQEAKLRATAAMAGSRLPVIPDSPLGGRDILDYVNDNPLYIPRKGSADAGQAENNWAETYNVPLYYRKFLGNSERGHNAADLAHMAYEDNYISEPTADALMAKVDETIRARTNYKVDFRKREKSLEAEGKSVLNFEKDQTQGANKGKDLVPFDDVAVGYELTINDENVVIRKIEYDYDGRLTNIVIEDGKRYGVLSLDPQARAGVFVDEWTPKPRETLAEDPFSMSEIENTDGSVTVNIPLEDEVLPMSARYQTPAVSGPLPSTVGNAAPPAVTQTWSGTVHTLHGIRRHLLNTVGLPAVGVGRFKGALGIYKAKPEVIRLQAINDIPVLAHEVGHALHYRVLSDQTPGQRVQATDWGGVYDAELLAMGQATSAPTYTPDQVRKEGVAEFIRGWLVDPVGTRAKAPRFSGHFEAEMQRRAPEMLEGLSNTRFMIQDYIAMPAFQKAKAQVVFDPASERQAWSWPEWLKKTYAQAVNTIQPALDVTRAAATQPGLETQAADVEAWMENHRGGWASKAGADVFGNQTDLFGNRVGEGLKSILSGLRPGENQDFSAYLALKRAAEIERSGRRSGFENAKLPASEMSALEARFEPIRQKLIKWQRNERNLLVQAGLLDSKAAADMDAANADYVPFYRLYEKLNGVSFGPEGGKNAGGYVDLNSGIRALKGSDRAIIDPLQSAMKNAFMFRKIAEQNLIGQKFFDLVKEAQGGGKWGDAISPKMKPTTIGHDTIVQKLIDEGIIKDASMLPSSADLTLRLFQAVTKPDTKNGEVIIFRDGKREHWEVKDPLLMNALRYADADSVKLGSIPSWMVKIMTVPTKVLRWGATGGPWFALPNMIRDAVQGGVLSKNGFIPFVDSFRGAMQIMSKSGVYELWKEAGGQFSGAVTGSEAFSSLLEDALPKDPIARRAMQGLADPKAWRGGFRNALRLIGSVGQFTEEATRVGEFNRALKAGKNSMQAANMSKVVSLNFARAGEVSRVLNQFIPFFNATIQGLDQLVRAHADPKTRGATITKGLLYITAPSVACWALGKDDPEIQNLPEWRKNMFWNINLKPLAAQMGEEGFILSIPKPFLLGAIYGTSVERGLDYATGRDPNGAKKAAENILGNTINPFDIMTGVAGMRPLYEAWANKSLFTDRNIVPDSMQNLPPQYQYTTLTSQTAKMIGGWTGQSPMIIDHLIRGYFATAGRFGTDAIDYGMTKMGGADAPPAAAKGWMELPILSRFAGSPYEANAFVDRAYNSAKEMEGLMSTWNKQADQMTTDEQAKYWQKNGDLIMQFTRTVDARTGLTGAGQVRKAMTSLGEISKAMKEVQASRVMTPDVKATRLRELAKQRNLTAEETFKTLMPAEIRKKHY